ncbi:MAG TPA: tetraacyldisaccharide 4'-kinase [Planctomycetes bacterium]|nr:tetraacyldisaccharide 4'-kinase [Planctomycetota bacterium]
MSMGSEAPLRLDRALAHRGGFVECLRAPAALFGAAARLRGWLYDRRLLSRLMLDTPVISVGNLSAGGTGKTPMTVWLAREAIGRGLRPGILSRGYKRGSASVNDEGQLLATLLPDVSHVQNPDRVAGGKELERQGMDWIVLDDGFQHRRLARQLDVVLVDASRPWGLPEPPSGGSPVCALLPRGLLREPPSSLARADLLVLTRCDSVNPERLSALREELRRWAPGVGQALASHRPVGVRTLEGGQWVEREPSFLDGLEVDLVSAIGNPEAFERTARDLGAHITHVRSFPDHHAYKPADLKGLGQRPVLVTAKDAVKLRDTQLPIHALDVEFTLVEGEPLVQALLDSLPVPARRSERDAMHAGLHG